MVCVSASRRELVWGWRARPVDENGRRMQYSFTSRVWRTCERLTTLLYTSMQPATLKIVPATYFIVTSSSALVG